MSFFTRSEPVVVPEGAKHFLSSSGMEVLAQDICFVYCQFNAESFTPELHQYLNVPAEPSLQNAVLKRRAEFLAGRYVARIALECLNIQSFALCVGKNRQPMWPQGIVGSISHTNTHAVSVVSPSLCYLGVDIELLLTSEQAREISDSVARAEEYKRICDRGMSFQFAVSLLFSAKESLFKAIFPRVGRYLDFCSSKLIDIDTEKKVLRLRLKEELQTETGFYHDFDCYYLLVDSAYVLTLVYGDGGIENHKQQLYKPEDRLP
jgi:enterobactin synthetase component D